MKKQIAIFLLIIIGTVITTYYTSPIISSLYYLGMLIAYFRSKNEAMWLAVFLVVSDGFIGFFGPYHTTLSMIPGLPPIDSILSKLICIFKTINITLYGINPPV